MNILPPDGWELRPAQVDAIRRIEAAFAAGKKVVALQGPTGSGKSLIGVTTALGMANSYYLVPLRALQDQIAADFGGHLNIFKGKANYMCSQFPTPEVAALHPGLSYRVDNAPCQDRGMSQQRKRCRESGVCDYYTAFEAAAKGKHVLMNFSLYLAWMRLREKMPERAPFVRRSLHIIDEAHRIEDFLRDHLTVEISTKRLAKYLPVTTRTVWDLDKDSLFEFMENLKRMNNVELAHLRTLHGHDLEAVATEIGSDKLDFHLKLDQRLELYFDEPENYTFGVETRFSRGEEVKYIVVKPLFMGGFINSNVIGERTLLLSATLPRRAVNQMGFKDEDFEYIEMPSTFPAANRLIKFRGVGRINKDNQEEMVPRLARATEKVLSDYATSKGIIHTNSYRLSRMLVEEIDPSFRPRLLIQDPDGDTAKQILEQHVSSPDPTVLLSPGMKEGIDLKDDLSRFQVILKCPYPNLGDPAVKALAEKDHLWFVTKTLTDFLQMYGRSIRSADDFAETICLDDNLRILLADHRKMVPAWVMEAVRWVG